MRASTVSSPTCRARMTSAPVVFRMPRRNNISNTRKLQEIKKNNSRKETLKIEDDADGKRLVITRDDGEEDVIVPISRHQHLLVGDGDFV